MKKKIPWLFLGCLVVLTLVTWSCGCTTPEDGEEEEEEEEVGGEWEEPGDMSPSWSPDGNKITFYSNRDGNSEIYVMNADGTGQTRLTNNVY